MPSRGQCVDSSSSENGSTIVLTQAAQGALSPAAVRAEMEKVLAAACLRDSHLLKRFLRYAVEHTLAGEGGQLKEYSLGVDVFGAGRVLRSTSRPGSQDGSAAVAAEIAGVLRARRLARSPAN
jgi:hypothetical protein